MVLLHETLMRIKYAKNLASHQNVLYILNKLYLLLVLSYYFINVLANEHRPGQWKIPDLWVSRKAQESSS